jgi:hypothetical protein
MAIPDNFTDYYKTISNAELIAILENPGDYQPLAIEAAKKEFNNRQLSQTVINETKDQIKAKQLLQERKKEKVKAIGDKVKNAGHSFIDTINPIQSEIHATDRMIRIICIVFGAIFLYEVLTEFKMLKLMIGDVRAFDLSSILFFLPFIITPLAIIGFLKKHTTGWVLLTILIIYSAVTAIFLLLQAFTWKSSGISSFDNFFPRPNPVTYIVQLSFLASVLYTICKKNMREIFKINNQMMMITIVASGLVTLFFLLII